MIVSIEKAMQHLCAVDEDLPQVESKLLGAIKIAENFIGRKIYLDHTELQLAKAEAMQELTKIANGDYKLVDDNLPADKLLHINEQIKSEKHYQQMAKLRGIVVDSGIETAILLILGTLYAHREDTALDSAMQLPLSAEHILKPYRVMGV